MDTSKILTPELQGAVAGYINLMGEYTKKGVAAASQEIPAIIQEYIKLLFVEHVFWAAAALAGILITVSLLGYLWYITKHADEDPKWTIRFFATLASLLPLGLGFIPSFIEHTIISLQIYYAPKAFLIKHVLEMMSK